MPRPGSLRGRLLLGLALLTTVGCVVISGVTYTQQRSFLLARVDQQAVAAANPVSFNLDAKGINASGADKRTSGARSSPAGPSGHGVPHSASVDLPPGTFGERRDTGGHIIGSATFSYGQAALAAPDLPAHISVTTSFAHPKLVTVHAVGSSDLSYRVMDFRTGDQSGTTIVAIPLRDVDQALARLLRVELLVSGSVLLTLLALAWWVVRIGLRPLDWIATTAGAIARGDLSRRVEPATEDSEVGRLGLALNAMLGQIEQAFGERQASEDRLRNFIADASHELRTPLASIRGYAELFRIGAVRDPADIDQAMTRIENEAARMGALVDDLMTLARLDELPRTAAEPVSLSALATDAAADACAAAPDREISLHVEDAAIVRGDPDRLRQVIANLMRNAIVHTPAGTPIDLTLSRAGHESVIEVRDHGPGLPSGAELTVWNRFWRAEGGRERGKAGAGLGLAIVAAIITAHGGSVDARNAAGGGASFTVRLPALEDSLMPR
ncbi:MAG: HAMP domain-containing histidine kinase [Actinomycetota bacterium]|nr:HAMP domain-containing histidine kinase [Actinomycetota bacterium]